MKRNTSGGFTIVELLMVVSIIALSIEIRQARGKARTTICQSNLRQIAMAHNTYAGDWEDAQLSLNRYSVTAYGNMACVQRCHRKLYKGMIRTQKGQAVLAAPPVAIAARFGFWPVIVPHVQLAR